jgi:hypothetical protein
MVGKSSLSIFDKVDNYESCENIFPTFNISEFRRIANIFGVSGKFD